MDWTFSLGSLTFGLLDVISISLVLLGAITGCAAGFSRVVAKNFGAVLCFPIALLFTNQLSLFILDLLGLSRFLSSMLSFALLSVLIYAIINLIGGLLGDSLSVLGLGVVDSILGFAWGLVVMAFFVSLLMALLSFQTFIDFTPLKDNSILYHRFIEPLFPSALEIVKGALSEIA